LTLSAAPAYTPQRKLSGGKNEVAERRLPSSSQGSSNAQRAKHRTSYSSIVSWQPLSSEAFFSNSVSAFSRFTVVKKRC